MTPNTSENCSITRASLLARLKDWNDEEGWQEFFDTYWQLIYRVGLKSGLTEAEAQDAVQDTLVAVSKTIRGFKYDRARCRFKSWLMLLTRQRIIWQLRQRLSEQHRSSAKADEATARTSTINRIPDPKTDHLEVIWEEEWQQNILASALERVKEDINPRQFQIFDLYVLRNWPVQDIVRTLHISSGQVYLAKHRVMSLLRKHLKARAWGSEF